MQSECTLNIFSDLYFFIKLNDKLRILWRKIKTQGSVMHKLMLISGIILLELFTDPFYRTSQGFTVRDYRTHEHTLLKQIIVKITRNLKDIFFDTLFQANRF